MGIAHSGPLPMTVRLVTAANWSWCALLLRRNMAMVTGWSGVVP